MLDPGIGFGKTAEQNLAVLRSLDRLVALGFPTMLGTSRKSTIGKLTGRGANERVFGTAATTALAVRAGIDVVRVHDVAAARDVVAVADAIVRGWRPPTVDRISLRGVRAYGRHGARAAERAPAPALRRRRDGRHRSRAARRRPTTLHATIDYAALHARLVAIVATTSYALLERLAGDLLDAVFDDARIARARR